MNVLIIQTAFIGDIILTTPLIIEIQKLWPGVHIDFVTTKAGAEIVKGFEKVNAIEIDKSSKIKSTLTTVQAIRQKKYDAVFCVHQSIRSLILARSALSKRRLAFTSAASIAMGFETVAYPEYSEKVHYSDKPLMLLSHLSGHHYSTSKPKLYFQSTRKINFNESYFVLSPFSVWGTKRWLPERFAEVSLKLAKQKKWKVIITGAGSEQELKSSIEIESSLNRDSIDVVNLVGKTTINDLKEIISKAQCVLTNDSAAIHIASAFNIPTVAIFGPTVKKWGFFPLSDQFAVVERQDVPCRPCSLHGPMKCPKTHFDCMNKIESEDVYSALLNVLNEKRT